MNPNVDLRQLAVRRDEKLSRGPARPRHWLTRYLLPGIVLAGFVAVSGWAASDRWLPSKPVTVVPVLATRAEVRRAGVPLFQAAGWIEPRPTPTLVTALSEGVVEQLLVVEDQLVQAGQPVARLIDADARLGLNAAESELRLKQAEADALLAKTDSDLKYLPFHMRSAEARRQLAAIDLETKKHLPSAVPAISIQRAESELASASAAVEELAFRKQRLEREVASLQRMREALLQGKELRSEPGEVLTETEAAMRASLCRVQQAQVAVDTARLRLKRMTVPSPVTGRVLALLARPGSRLVGMAPGAQHEASTVVSLYNPSSLQIRADVRLEDVPRVQPGQPVRIETPAASGPLEGEVLFATSQADIQKNTLAVKVAVKSPPPTIKPDMLVQVTFLAVANPAGKVQAEHELRLLVPRQLVESGGQGTCVWIADQVAGVARQRTVKLGQVAGNDLVEVVEGLNAADKLIAGSREGLSDGQRITVLGEDATLGTSSREGGSRPARLPRTPAADGGHKTQH